MTGNIYRFLEDGVVYVVVDRRIVKGDNRHSWRIFSLGNGSMSWEWEKILDNPRYYVRLA